MVFPENYFEDEVREGFFIPSMMKRCWAAQLQVLEDIDALCEKYNIRYFADSGTLIGAVRHGGFIPWDDDSDIGMLREDYEKFLEHADELPENYSVLNWRRTEEWANAYSRVVNTEEITFDEKHLETYHGFPYAAGVDIFVVDYLYRNPDKEEERRQKAELFMQVASALVTHKEQDDEYWNMVESMENTYEIYIDKEKNIPMQFYAYAEDVLREVKREDADEVAFMAAWVNFHSSNCPKKAYLDTMRVPFETISIPIPVYYDDVLKSRYGEYMRVNKYGGMHDYPYYRAQEHILEEKYGWKIWHYNWNPDELTLGERVRKEYRGQQDGIKAQIAQIEAMIQSNPDVYGSLQSQVDGLKANLFLEQENNDVVFLTIGPRYWKNYEYFYKKEKENGANVYVIAIPYYDTVMDGRVEGQHFTLDGYPDEVSVIPYDAYDLQKNHPKKIYFQVAYDAENPSLTVHPTHYSSELLKHTDELIYVPYLNIKDLEYTDDKSFFSMNYYVKMPGVIHADKVILPTENLRENYLRALCDFSGEEYREAWEKKLSVEDYMPEESHEGKKRVLYFTDAAPLMIYGQKALDKIQRNLKYFKNVSERIELYWKPYDFMEEKLSPVNAELYEELCRLEEDYQTEGWGHFVSPEDAILLSEMDAYVGDPGAYAYHICQMRKPTLITDDWDFDEEE